MLSIQPKQNTYEIRKHWGMHRSLLNNAVIGVSQGYEKILELSKTSKTVSKQRCPASREIYKIPCNT